MLQMVMQLCSAFLAAGHQAWRLKLTQIAGVLQMEFGADVRTIVEGETKFSKLGELSSEMVSKGDVKARDLQHLFLAMTKEV